MVVKIYFFYSAVVIDHDWLFTHVATGYIGSFHDARVLRATEISINWQENFTTGTKLQQTYE